MLPALDAAYTLEHAITVLRGRVIETIVVDGGSADATVEVAERLGARIERASRGRGQQLATGADAASGEWLLFLHADTRLASSWPDVVGHFIALNDNRERAAYFRFRIDDEGTKARRLERLVGWRCRRLGLPYGDQGLLIHRDLYRRIGGFRLLPIMEDVDLARRLGRARLQMLDCDAVTSAARYRRDGYWRRSARNLVLLSLYWLGVPPRLLVRAYG